MLSDVAIMIYLVVWGFAFLALFFVSSYELWYLYRQYEVSNTPFLWAYIFLIAGCATEVFDLVVQGLALRLEPKWVFGSYVGGKTEYYYIDNFLYYGTFQFMGLSYFVVYYTWLIVLTKFKGVKRPGLVGAAAITYHGAFFVAELVMTGLSKNLYSTLLLVIHYLLESGAVFVVGKIITRLLKKSKAWVDTAELDNHMIGRITILATQRGLVIIVVCALSLTQLGFTQYYTLLSFQLSFESMLRLCQVVGLIMQLYALRVFPCQIQEANSSDMPTDSEREEKTKPNFAGMLREEYSRTPSSCALMTVEIASEGSRMASFDEP